MASVVKVRKRSGNEIEALSKKIIETYQPDALKEIKCFDVEAFFDCELENVTGIEAVRRTLPDGLDGYTDFEKMKCFISMELVEYDNFDNVTKRRLRSTLAHEIGHCFLHFDDVKNHITSQKQFLHNSESSFARYNPDSLEICENPEWQAWRFASSLLMPEITFRTAVERNYNKTRLKRVFDVNPAFIDVRARELKISRRL
jgi:Zn-dependent peptidase ImmA (M78 family)